MPKTPFTYNYCFLIRKWKVHFLLPKKLKIIESLPLLLGPVSGNSSSLTVSLSSNISMILIDLNMPFTEKERGRFLLRD